MLVDDINLFIDTSAMNFQSFSMFHGTAVSTNVSGSKDSIGMAFFDRTKINNTSGPPRFYFRAIFATNQTSTPAYCEMTDYSGIITGFPGPVAGTVLTSSQLEITQYEVDVTGYFLELTGSGIIETRMWVANSGSGQSGVIKSARLDVEWP